VDKRGKGVSINQTPQAMALKIDGGGKENPSFCMETSVKGTRCGSDHLHVTKSTFNC